MLRHELGHCRCKIKLCPGRVYLGWTKYNRVKINSVQTELEKSEFEMLLQNAEIIGPGIAVAGGFDQAAHAAAA